MNKRAIYPGSFDPFTNGHLDVIMKAASLFEHVVVAIGINSAKQRHYDIEQTKSAIEDVLMANNLTNCSVCIYSGLVAEYAAENHIDYMIRGLRNTTDYSYEENIAEVNKLINPKLEYVYFRASHIGVSSSMVRELLAYGKDVSPYVPTAILPLIQP